MARNLRQNALSHGSHRRPVRLHGRFTLAGASDPSVVAGCVQSVKRYETAGAVPFFRVKLDTSYQLANSGSVVVVSCTGAITLSLSAQNGEYTSDPLVARDPLREIDVVVKDGGTAVDTAGIVVNLWLALDIAPRTA